MLARADAESLEFESARQRLEALRETGQARDPGYWLELGNTEEQLDHGAQAIACWRKSCELAPGHPSATRKLAMALVRAGDPEGRELVERILRANPKDTELQAFAGDGPYPPPKKGYEPLGGH